MKYRESSIYSRTGVHFPKLRLRYRSKSALLRSGSTQSVAQCLVFLRLPVLIDSVSALFSPGGNNKDFSISDD